MVELRSYKVEHFNFCLKQNFDSILNQTFDSSKGHFQLNILVTFFESKVKKNNLKINLQKSYQNRTLYFFIQCRILYLLACFFFFLIAGTKYCTIFKKSTQGSCNGERCSCCFTGTHFCFTTCCCCCLLYLCCFAFTHHPQSMIFQCRRTFQPSFAHLRNV